VIALQRDVFRDREADLKFSIWLQGEPIRCVDASGFATLSSFVVNSPTSSLDFFGQIGGSWTFLNAAKKRLFQRETGVKRELIFGIDRLSTLLLADRLMNSHQHYFSLT
jgi:hypothetical protein